jgi:PAP2 superfamily
MSNYLLQPGARQAGASSAALSALTPYEPPFGPQQTPIGPPALSALTPYEPPFGSHFTPIGPPGPRLTPIGPPGPRLTPIGPPALSAWTPIGPPASSGPAPTPAPLPWDGIDPAWVYSSGAALMGQALRKSRAKIVRRAERGAQTSSAPEGAHLLRWEGQFRVNALQSELLGRFQVHGAALWLLEPVGSTLGSAQTTATRVFEIRKHRGELFGDQVDKVLRAAVEREDRLPEILSQANDFWPFFESIVGANLSASPRLAELLAVAHGLAVHLVMALKQGVAARRPVQCSSLVMPVIATPGHASLPSGHATIAALNSEVLTALLYSSAEGFAHERAVQLDRLARRIAFNRVVAGVHFPIDSVVGYGLGTQIARLLLAMAGAQRKPPQAMDDHSFDAIGGKALDLAETEASRPVFSAGDYPCSKAPAFADLWQRTQDELRDLRV